MGIRQHGLVRAFRIKLVEVGTLLARARINDPVFAYAARPIFIEFVLTITLNTAVGDDLDHEIGRALDPLVREAVLVLARNKEQVRLA